MEWRERFKLVGNYLKGEHFVNVLLAVMGVAYAGRVIVNVYIGVIKQSGSLWQRLIELITDTFIVLLALLLLYLFFQGLGNAFIWVSKYYPKWYYKAKMQISAAITPKNEIEIYLRNLEDQEADFWVQYERLESKIKPLPGQASGRANPATKYLLHTETIPGKGTYPIRIGKVDNGSAILSAGEQNGEMKLDKSGFYRYYIFWTGIFRGKSYGDVVEIPIVITLNHEVKLGKPSKGS